MVTKVTKRKTVRIRTKTVRIGTKTVPVADGRTMAFFQAGRMGSLEKGTYQFWTAVCMNGRTTKEVSGRNLEHLDAGERFRRIFGERLSAKTKDHRKAYTRLSLYLRNVVYVRPATVIEVASWLASHKDDAIHLKTLRFL